MSDLDAHMTFYSRFTYGLSRHTLNLASAAWVLYSPTGDLVRSSGTYLGPTMNNLIEYHVVIGLLTKAFSNNVSWVRVYLDS